MSSAAAGHSSRNEEKGSDFVGKAPYYPRTGGVRNRASVLVAGITPMMTMMRHSRMHESTAKNQSETTKRQQKGNKQMYSEDWKKIGRGRGARQLVDAGRKTIYEREI